MIEKLTNCPNCDGILDESGRCIYCGSKVFDFLSIDFTHNRSRATQPKTYIRIRTGKGIVLAPINISSVTLTSRPIYAEANYYHGVYLDRNQTDMNIECQVCGDMIMIDDEAKDER